MKTFFTIFSKITGKKGFLRCIVALLFALAIGTSADPQTLYSYQSGDWNTAATWTTDPSGTLYTNPTMLVPIAGTTVVILNGRTITVADNTLTCTAIEIKEGGILSLAATTGHNFGTVTGKGTIQMEAQAATFGAGTTFTTFVQTNGGTFELVNSASFNLPSILNSCNNLIINNTGTNIVVTLLNNLTIRGDFTIQNGTFKINSDASATALTISLDGDLEVSSTGRIRTGLGNAGGGHHFIIKGDFTNNGNVWFSNLSAPLYQGYPNTGYVHTVFNDGTKDQSILCNDTTKFYRIEIAKGVDKTYVLNVDAANSNYFKLFGNNFETPTWIDEATNDNALGLESGTCRLGNNIMIPCLTTGYYYIKDPACLWIDGAQIIFRNASYTPQPDPGVDNCGLYIYGKLKMTGTGSFILNGFSYRGVVFREASSMEFHDNSVFIAPMMRPSANGNINRGSFVIDGNASVTFTGNTYDGRFATFDLGFPENLFEMAGGTLTINSPTSETGVANLFSLRIACDTRNTNVTGGTVRIEIPSNVYFNTTAPFWNLILNGTSSSQNASIRYIADGGGSAAPELIPQPLIVKNTLTLNDHAVLVMNNTNGSPLVVDAAIGKDFIIQSNALYTPGSNTTIFNGTGGQNFTNAGTISTGLNNLTLAGTSNTSISNNLTIRGILTIGAGTLLNDVGNTIRVAGNIVNNGTHTSQAAGSITLNGGAVQSVSGSGNGVFGNLIQNNTNGITFLADQKIAGDLRLPVNATFNLGIYNLKFSPSSHVYSVATGTTASFSDNRMIMTAGNESDGGITKQYDASNVSFTYPFGVSGKYTPARIQVNSASSPDGTITIRPVNRKSPFTNSNNVLSYYWKTRSSGFTGSQSVRLSYRYMQSDVLPAAPPNMDNSYVGGVYANGGWFSMAPDLSTVDENNDSIKFPTTISSGMTIIDGDYTAGAADAFTSIKAFYSRQTGNWNDNNSWSNDSVGGPACPAGAVPGVNIPGPSNPVIIGNGSSYNHYITVPATFNGVSTGSLQINNGSTLDLTSSTGHNFGSIPDAKVAGNGTLKISSANDATATAQFPAGDFGLFLDSLGGTVEYYSSATLGAGTMTVPSVNAAGLPVTNYRNLVLSPYTGKVIVMPNSNLTIFTDLTINGSTTGIARLSVSGTNTYTVTVKGDISVNGTLQYPNIAGMPQNVVNEGNTIINSGGSFTVNINAQAVANRLTVYGNITNNGILDFYPAAAPYADIIFLGADNKEINGTTATRTRLNAITINKGTSRNSVLDVTVNNTDFWLNTALANALTLTNGTFRLTTNTTINLSTDAFTIPVTGCLSANGGSFNVATSNADASDLSLNGRIEVIAGTITVGTTGNTNNNDIEYASAGTPEIIVRGGVLNVLGQVRRSTIIETGSLCYTQTGGQVTINGTDAQNARSIFEVLNPGSLFRMSGGTLTLTGNFNNSSYTDLYIMPDTSDVTGGTIQLGTTITGESQFNVVLASPVWNLNIDGTANAKTVNLWISPLQVLNDLTISNPTGSTSALVTNGFDVSIGHNLFNYNTNNGTTLNNGGYQATLSTQNTTLNGSSMQLITGYGTNITNFANLIISNSSAAVVDSLAPSTNIRVNGNLTLVRGILADGTNDITVMGDISNTAVHRSFDATGGIFMTGSQKQFVSGDGNGVFGNVTINNPTGVDMVDNSTVNGRLTLTAGLFYIDDMLLTMGADASIGGSPGVTNMIRVNGALSDLGVKKIYKTGANSFVFPVGVSGKYTPATLNVTANTYSGNSSITVKPINAKHPATDEIVPLTNELQYYWNVISTGFNNGVTITHTYKYINTDALPDETGYVAARYFNFNWTTPPEGLVTPASDLITFTGVNYINGEYTCGVNTNFQNLQTFYSRSATAGLPAGASWDLATSWTLASDGNGPAAPYFPNGNPVEILPGHKINAVNNGNKSYSILLNGTLDLGATINHSHGHVSGNGTLIIASTHAGYFVFPGGEYDDFMKTTGATVEYQSEITSTLPNSIGTVYKPYQNLRFTGAGIKYLASVNMKVRGYLNIQNGFLSNVKANKNIYLLGNWIDAVTNGFTAGEGLVSFEGTGRQLTSINSSESFYNLSLNNPAGDSIIGGGSNTLSVGNLLTLTQGNLMTDANHILHITNSSPSAVVGGSTASFINGPMRKTVNKSSYFDFPVGKTGRYGNVYVSDLSDAGILEAEYYTTNPFNASLKLPPIDTVTSKEHWRIGNAGAITGRVRIRWDNLSDIIPATAIGRTKLKVVEWNGTAWETRDGIVNGVLTSGTIQMPDASSLNGDHYCTIGLESLPTATITSGDDAICDDGIDAATVLVDLTGIAPWSIKYKINGANEQTINYIGSSPATVVLNSASPGFAGPGTYNFNVSYISDGSGSTGIRDFVKTIHINVNESPDPVISGKNPVSQNEPSVIYNVAGGAGHTYNWIVTGGTITAGQGTSQITVTWGTGSAGMVEVTETITATGCYVTASKNITINLAPSPLVTGNISVCSGVTETYLTGAAASHMFIWTVTGGTIVGGVSSGTGLNSIQVKWGTSGAGSVKVEEQIPSPLGIGTNTLDVTINPLPDNSLTVTDPVICLGGTAGIVVRNAESGMDYTLRLNSDNSVITTVHTAMPGDVTLNATPAGKTEYNVLVENEYNCIEQLTDLSTVTVLHKVMIPVFVAGDSSSRCGGSGTVIYTANSDYANALSYSLDNASVTEGNTIDTQTGEVRFMDHWTGPSIITVTAEGCGGPLTSTHKVFADIPVTSSITGESQPLCSASGENYSVELRTGSSYEWMVPEGATIVSGTTGPENSSIEVDFSINSGPIRVIETNINGCKADTVSLDIELQGCELTADFTANDTLICPGQTVTFTDASTGINAYTSYTWIFGEGASPDTATGSGPQQVTYLTSGTKTVMLIISNGLADTLTKVDYITVSTPAVTISSEDRCGTGTVDFLAVSTGDQVEFSVDGGSSVASKDQTVPYTYSTTISEGKSLQVWARAYNSATGCTGTWDSSVVVRAFNVPVAGPIVAQHAGDYEAGYVDVVCAGTEKSGYYVDESPGSVYTWNIPELNITISNTASIEINWPLASAVYHVEVTEISGDGCSSGVSDTLIRVSMPDPSLGEDVSLCTGQNHVFEPDGDYVAYEWQDHSTGSAFTASASDTVTVQVTDEYACEGYDTVIVTMHENPVVNLGPDTVLCEGNTLMLDAGDFENYEWSTGQTGNPVEIHEGAGAVSVTVTDINGCEGTGQVTISNCSPENLLVIPNTFTPNNDGHHDIWLIKNINMFPDADIQVFDRWGRRVYQSDGGSGREWDGKGPNGKELPVENYYYVIDLKVPGSEILTGTVSIIR